MTHEAELSRKAESGCLVIADLSGYTDYLQSTELEHAEDVLADLTDTVIAQLQPILTISKLEGDAVFCYALDGSTDATMLLDGIDTAYFEFRKRMRNITQATTCDCNACRRIPTINLKFVAHHGRFVRREVAGQEELTGTDVVLVHRLLKNTIVETQGIEAYAFFTEPVLDVLSVDADTLKMVPHTEEYDDVGLVTGHVEDLAARWEYEQERRRDYVGSDDPEFEVVEYFDAPPPLVWDFVTRPSKRLLWEVGLTELDENTEGGRRGAGTWNHCVHGKRAMVQEFTDWRPFRYFTSAVPLPLIGPWKWTLELRPVGEGTEFHIRGAKLQALRQRLGWMVLRRTILRQGEERMRLLRGLLAEEVRNLDRKVVAPET